MEEIILLEKLMIDNLIRHFKIKDIEYLEYLQNNIEELQKLKEKNKIKNTIVKHLTNYHIITPQDMNIDKTDINKLKIKIFREVKKYPRTNKNRSILFIIDLFYHTSYPH